MNELILICTLFVVFGLTLLAYRLFGRAGLYCMSVLATVFANIEVLVLIRAFGMEQTLGNILFAATFLITDILSECEGKKAANKAVWLGIFASAFFLVLSQSWLWYRPSEADTVMPSMRVLFTGTPRILLASFTVYAVSQMFDVWLYHKWWTFTEKRFGDKRRFLWLRNNGSTLVSQLLNTALFTIIAFAGTYDILTLLSIFGSSYVIFIVTSLADTPVLYLARRMRRKMSESQPPAAPAESGAEEKHG